MSQESALKMGLENRVIPFGDRGSKSGEIAEFGLH
jgi:hypothetical protein